YLLIVCRFSCLWRYSYVFTLLLFILLLLRSFLSGRVTVDGAIEKPCPKEYCGHDKKYDNEPARRGIECCRICRWSDGGQAIKLYMNLLVGKQGVCLQQIIGVLIGSNRPLTLQGI